MYVFNIFRVVKLYPNDGAVEIFLSKQSPKYFTFDAVYDGG